jgi:hypothetical protein
MLPIRKRVVGSFVLLVKLLKCSPDWQGVDAESGERVALYTFEAKPREAATEVPF